MADYLYNQTALASSKAATQLYSTSFASSIRLLSKDIHGPIYAIYGFVRFADEIVDTFHAYNKASLLQKFKADTFVAINDGISLNPILQSFQLVVNEYKIDLQLVEAFFKSMEMDLHKKNYESYEEYSEYIHGSAEAVGLMCLRVFCSDCPEKYDHLKPSAKALGAAFQKINFLRDVNADYLHLQRNYFPNVKFDHLNESAKQEIVLDIKKDLREAISGIKMLPIGSRFGVLVAYKYYTSLLRKIELMPVAAIKQQRVRIADYHKMYILAKSYFRHKLQLIG